MQLKFVNIKEFKRSWRNDFLGQDGFLLPASTRINLGETINLNVTVQGEQWGQVEVTPVWANRDVRNDPEIPLGIFLRRMSADRGFDRQINALG